MSAIDGWWWNPTEGGRGFFVERRGSHACVACCLYSAAGLPEWHWVGPLAARDDGALEGASSCMRLPGADPGAHGLPFRLELRSEVSARLRWGGVDIALTPQHSQERSRAGQGPLTGCWVEQAPKPLHALACEQLGRRLIATLLSPSGWFLLEAERRGDSTRPYRGKWWRFEGGQALGAAYRAPTGAELPGEAAVTCNPDGTLRVRAPGGTEHALRRVALSADVGGPQRPEVAFSTQAAAGPASGLVPLYFDLEARGEYSEQPCRLAVEALASGTCFEMEVHLGGWPRKVMLAVNTHLLPNGSNSFRAHLARTGRELWRTEFTLTVSNRGPLADEVRASLRASGAPLLIADAVDSTHFDFSDRSLTPWFDREGAAERVGALRRVGSLGEAEAAALRQFVEEGYMVLPEPIEEALLRRIDAELEDTIARKVDGYEYGTSQRICNLHLRYPGIRALWRHPMIMRYLELVFGVPARPCQTLTYVFGSQQEAHQDTVHLTPFPAGYMCGVWVALEDVKPDSGELEVFPRTHRLPRVYMQAAGCPKVADDDWSEFGEKVVARYRRMLDEGGFGKVTYRPRRGSVLVWHENLLHGGSVRVDASLSRRSIVSHYFADGAVAFYDSTGKPGYMD